VDVADRVLGVSTGHRAEVGDDTGRLATRDRGERRRGDRPRLAPPRRGVEQVYAGRGDRDPDLSRPRLEVRQLAEDKVAGGPRIWWSWIALIIPVNECKLT
jgi:hypothetical protein